jgi:hypothetical protein
MNIEFREHLTRRHGVNSWSEWHSALVALKPRGKAFDAPQQRCGVSYDSVCAKMPEVSCAIICHELSIELPRVCGSV